MRQETAAGDILATGIHLTLEGVGIQELYVAHGPSNGLVSGYEKFHSQSSGADKGEAGSEIGVLEEVVPELFRLLEREARWSISTTTNPEAEMRASLLRREKNAVGRYERQLSLFELAVFRYPAFPDEGA